MKLSQLHFNKSIVILYGICGLLIGAPTLTRADDALDELLKKYAGPQPSVTKQESRPQPAVETLPKPKVVEKKTAHPHTIQVASYQSEQEASARVDELRKQNLPASYTAVEINGRIWHRCNIGSFPSRKAAQYFLENNTDKAIQSVAVISRLNSDRSPASTTLAKPSHPRKPTPSPRPQPVPQPPPTAPTAPSETPPVEEKKEAPPAAEVSEPEDEQPLGLFGDWGGRKKKWKAAGVDARIKYKSDVVRNFSGGNSTQTAYLGNLDLLTELDLETLANLKGWNMVLYGIDNHGGRPSQYIGDTYWTSNIEAPATFKLYEAYLKKTVDDRFTIVFGLRDLNADYYVTDTSNILLNSAFGISQVFSQTGVNGPSIFPNTALALTFRYESPSSMYFQTGIFNATAGDVNHPQGTHISTTTDNGYLYIAETGFAGGKDAGRYKYGVGSWTYSKEQDPIDSTKEKNQNSGVYLLVDRNLTAHTAAFIKYGNATSTINEIVSSVETGLVFQGVIPGRSDDNLAVGVAHGSRSQDFVDINSVAKEEVVGEVSYQIKLPRGVSIMPDFQNIKNTGGAHGHDARVGSVRLDVEL